jgi:formate hydrogenlyase transcriptional activator
VRREDIPLLIQHFIQAYAAKLGKRITTVPERMTAALCDYGWPGNIRELQHVVERAVILTQGAELAPANGFIKSLQAPSPHCSLP